MLNKNFNKPQKKHSMLWFAVIVMATLSLNINNSNAQTTDLYPMMDWMGRIGFINQKGEVVVKPQFEYVSYGNYEGDDLILVKLKDKYGYIDKTGKFVLQPQYEDAHEFSEGLAGVKIDGKEGFIDKTGNMVITPRYDFVSYFQNGIACVQLNGKFGYINNNGDVVIKLDYEIDEIHEHCQEGMVPFKSNGKWGYYDNTGKVVIEPQFEFAQPYSEGVAAVKINGKYVLIDKTGKVISQPLNYKHIGQFSGGLAGVLDENSDNKYIDKTGKIVNRLPDDSFSDGLTFCFDAEKNVGYKDKNGKIVIEPKYIDGFEFYHGLALVQISETYGIDSSWFGYADFGYINKSGDIVYTFKMHENEDLDLPHEPYKK